MRQGLFLPLDSQSFSHSMLRLESRGSGLGLNSTSLESSPGDWGIGLDGCVRNVLEGEVLFKWREEKRQWIQGCVDPSWPALGNSETPEVQWHHTLIWRQRVKVLQCWEGGSGLYDPRRSLCIHTKTRALTRSHTNACTLTHTYTHTKPLCSIPNVCIWIWRLATMETREGWAGSSSNWNQIQCTFFVSLWHAHER